MLQVKRTLVKSVPELWTEIADAAAVARHLAPFGAVRILRAEPERFIEWEGDRGRGTVRLEPSGFGTRVVLTADTRRRTPDPQTAGEPAAPAPALATGRFRAWSRFRRREAPAPPAPAAPADPRPGPPSIGDDAALNVLADTLDALGRAHNRPFSRV